MKVSKLVEFKGLQDQVETLKAARESLLLDPILQNQIRALNRIEAEMAIGGISLADLIDHFQIPTRVSLRPRRVSYRTQRPGRARKARPVKLWVNPHTGEKHAAKRVSGPVLEWVKDYGRDEVTAWVV